VKDLPKGQYLLFTAIEWHSELTNVLCKIYLEKPHIAFVKVVGGFEIYNFCIQSLVHFYTRFWIYLISNRGPAKRFGRGHHRAGRPRRPRRALSKAARRQRPPAGQGSLFPIGRVLRPLESSPRAHHGQRRTGSVRAADRRSVGGCNTLKFPDFRMLIGRIIKTTISHNFKIFRTFIFFTGNLVKKIGYFSKINKMLL
jgi:hypothetical protein